LTEAPSGAYTEASENTEEAKLGEAWDLTAVEGALPPNYW
jgi:hypothetical protein